MSQHKVVVIGGGPSGLSAALYLARANLSPLVIAGDPPGGQLMLTSEVENFPGVRSMFGAELIALMRERAEHFGAKIVDANVTSVNFREPTLSVETDISSDSHLEAKSILIATGAKALWMGLESEKRLRGKGVSACATCDGFFFRNKTVAVLGGGDSALEEAIQLTKFVSKVYLIHRRDSFKASRIMQERVSQNEKIEILWNSQVTNIIGENKVEGIELVGKDEQHKHLDLQGVFVAIGHKPDTDLFKNQVILDDKGYVVTMSRLAEKVLRGMTIEGSNIMSSMISPYYSTATSVLGVFAAGDCVDDVYRQASTASGMGVAASIDIERYLEAQG